MLSIIKDVIKQTLCKSHTKSEQKKSYSNFMRDYPMFASITLTCKRPFYDNEFTITYSDGSEVVIKRDYDRWEQISDICGLIRNLPDTSADTVRSLDERNKIYYD